MRFEIFKTNKEGRFIELQGVCNDPWAIQRQAAAWGFYYVKVDDKAWSSHEPVLTTDAHVWWEISVEEFYRVKEECRTFVVMWNGG